jgi:hypothetical protein
MRTCLDHTTVSRGPNKRELSAVNGLDRFQISSLDSASANASKVSRKRRASALSNS